LVPGRVGDVVTENVNSILSKTFQDMDKFVEKGEIFASKCTELHNLVPVRWKVFPTIRTPHETTGGDLL
jgi:hypothetical protein